MYSYIGIHHFSPKTNYQPLHELIPLIEQTMTDQNVLSIIGEENLLAFKENIVRCMEVYYKLVGIDEEVIAGKGMVEPKGILPRYTESLIGYFQELERKVPADKEITVLEYSGVDTIKIRYKYTNSVIKKLVKLGLHDPKLFDDPLKIFLKGGALHDLVGMLFVCSYPYEKEWVARTLYNFFEYDNRTDDHLLYGFYTVEKKSGYRGLHCDHTLFNPRFDKHVSEKNDSISVDPNTLFTLLNPEDTNIEVLRKLKDYFNVEIQLHTTFESLWSSMEHTNNYNIQAKGSGRNSKITVQWKMLSDAMKNIEEQFERLQIDTEQARFEVLHHGGYIPIKNLLDELGSNTYHIHAASVKKVEDLEDDLKNHEVSRQDYVEKLQTEAHYIDDFASKQNDPSVEIIFKIHSAFIYYGLANQGEYFNIEDIHEFVKKALKSYKDISHFLSTHSEIHRGSLINIVAIFRYLYLGQKYGLGLMNPPKETFTDNDVPAISYTESLSFFETGISLLNRLGDEELKYLKRDSAEVIKIIHHYDLQSREWELFNDENDSSQSANIAKSIADFRKQFINSSLQEQFNTLLESDRVKNVGFVVKFYTTLVWHGFLRPRDALKQIIQYSAYDKIKASDLFYYELSAYRFLIIRRCETINDCKKELADRNSDPVRIEHYKNYHRKNMIQLLFRIRKNESAYKFNKARLYFEEFTQTQFKIDHFSDTIRDKEQIK
jgi:ppGpp synthetase/RelA/SpoT-type nucleotidyltranferase